MELVEALKSVGMENVASSIEKSIGSVREIEKVAIYSKKYVDTLNKLYNMISYVHENISKIGKELLRDELKNIISNLETATSYIRSRYERTKFIAILLTTLYAITSISLIASAAATEGALISANMILWLNIVVLTLFLLNMSSTLFIVLILPIASMFATIISTGIEKDIAHHALISMLHVVALIIAVMFLTQNISNYKHLSLVVLNIEKKLHNLAESIHELFSEKGAEVQIDIEKYLSLYSDKAYELIKYISDIQKLS